MPAAALPARPVVVDLNPVTVRVLKVDLLHPVYPDGGGFGCTGPVGVLNAVLVQVCDEILDLAYAEAQVVVLVWLQFFCRPLYQVQLTGRTEREPRVQAIVERLGYFLQLQHLFVKSCALP